MTPVTARPVPAAQSKPLDAAALLHHHIQGLKLCAEGGASLPAASLAKIAGDLEKVQAELERLQGEAEAPQAKLSGEQHAM